MKNKKNTESKVEETGVTSPHPKISDIGAGRQIGDPLGGTLSDRAGDEGFDDSTRSSPESKPNEELDDL